MWEVDVCSAKSGRKTEGPSVVGVLEGEDFLAACECNCSCYSHGVGFGTGVSEANEFYTGG